MVFEKIRSVRSAFHSICLKLPVRLIIPTLIAMLFSSYYFTISLRTSSIELYEQQTAAAFETSMKNIDYYISSCVSSSRSIYINDALLTFLRRQNKYFTTEEERDMIFSYLKTVYYSISEAKQIFLAVPRLNTSFLYITDNLWSSTTSLTLPRESLPDFSGHRDVEIEPTHFIGTYGHVVGFTNIEKDTVDNLVFTIWLPIYDIPFSDALSGYLAIDLPIEFIMKNCQLAYDETERVYMVDEQGDIVASSDESVIHQNISDFYEAAKELNSSGFDRIIDGDMLIMQSPMNMQYVNWKLVKAVPMKNIYGLIWNQGQIMLVTILIVLVIVLGINISQVLHYMIPVKQVTSYMSAIIRSKSWRKDITISDYVTYEEDDEIGVLIETFDTMMKSINDYTVRQFELELAYTRSVLKMLQAQINPHFIYNTMQCFATNALKSKNVEQYHLMSSFGQMLHYAMILEPSIVPFSKEVEYVKRYLELQKMRFNSEDMAEFRIEPGVNEVMIPKMILQPIIENSFIHGKIFHSSGSILIISAGIGGNFVRIVIEDNGEPVLQEEIQRLYLKFKRIRETYGQQGRQASADVGDTLKEEDENGGRVQGYGIGLENVYTRLLLCHGSCELKIFANSIGGTTTEMVFPISAEQGKS